MPGKFSHNPTTKLLMMPQPHRAEGWVLQVRRGPNRWETIPNLVYECKDDALDGLERIGTHVPHLKLRVQKRRAELPEAA